MGETIQFVPVYWALFSVVAMSCKFPIREKQSISAICEYKYEGSTSLRMLYIHRRGFLTGGSHVLFLCGFQQFYQFLFSFEFQHSKHKISCLLIISQKLKSFFVSWKYDEGSYNAPTFIFSTLYHFYSLMYDERSRDIQFLAEIQKFHNQTFHLFYSF